ncbi:hypothetical protein M407DRAFT_33584 [Tulasnella calospora MUT 4182]|uniref:Uncharacterized protein n=1 Tax=Tulasnella calospora MUT 4182 TaxID=1051891 RepID=A0A0C3L549_9AGAM|nr:hypothetical protein M407DRAFT_33584 [Tulasnella calospora MUT 4182]
MALDFLGKGKPGDEIMGDDVPKLLGTNSLALAVNGVASDGRLGAAVEATGGWRREEEGALPLVVEEVD